MTDWIEHLFHVYPDGGNGSLELLFFLAPMAAFLVGLVESGVITQKNKAVLAIQELKPKKVFWLR